MERWAERPGIKSGEREGEGVGRRNRRRKFGRAARGKRPQRASHTGSPSERARKRRCRALWLSRAADTDNPAQIVREPGANRDADSRDARSLTQLAAPGIAPMRIGPPPRAARTASRWRRSASTLNCTSSGRFGAADFVKCAAAAARDWLLLYVIILFEACGCGEIGRRAGFRFQFPLGREGSSPIIRTKIIYFPISSPTMSIM